jgi:hypothetical protein
MVPVSIAAGKDITRWTARIRKSSLVPAVFVPRKVIRLANARKSLLLYAATVRKKVFILHDMLSFSLIGLLLICTVCRPSLQ